MIGQVGSAPQFTPSVVQNSPQQSAAKQQVQDTVVRQQQQQAQEIIQAATSSPPVESLDPSAGRGQVVNLLV